jgi:hypothetical protein
LALPRAEAALVGEAPPPARRVEELPGLRTETAAFYELSDGRVEAEVSAAPVHYRDAEGRWRPIDVRVVAGDRDGYSFENRTNRFTSRLGPPRRS